MKIILLFVTTIAFLLASCSKKHNDDNAAETVEKSVIDKLVDNMVYVEGGTFMMGNDDKEANRSEKPAHPETVSSFYIGRYEVTQSEWEYVMGSNPSHFHTDASTNPVETVSWDDCQIFIQKLNELTGKTFRLPTEAEWEYAARGGNKSVGYKYSGSNNVDDVAWHIDSQTYNRTHPVGEKAPNELGLFDMSGNVSEWTSDKASLDYNSERTWAENVYRGGNFWTYRTGCEVYTRANTYRSNKYFYLGLRLAM